MRERETARFLGDLTIIRGMERVIPKTGNRRTTRKAWRFLLRASLKAYFSSMRVTLYLRKGSLKI
ncbi:MAG: hypothetical protein QW638_01205 [Candidatus Bathyarchaeia archaeon]